MLRRSKFRVIREKILNGSVWTKCTVKFFSRSKIRPVPCDRSLKVILHGTIRNGEFLLNTALQCWSNIVTIRNNVATLCCSKNRRYESSRVSSPLISKTTLCTCIILFCTFLFRHLHDYDVKMPNFTFYGVRNQANTKFSFSFWTSILFLRSQLPESSPTFDNVNELKQS